uniref:Uncharacterized protein n=1 Tax=Aegilops tauschii subsp. strangulata TaxID=200361 RepID=A0A453ISQ3_AEGTS
MCCCCALVQEWREVEIRGAYGEFPIPMPTSQPWTMIFSSNLIM